MKQEEHIKNYLGHSVLLTVVVVMVLVGLSLVRPYSFGVVDVRRANILSHVVSDSLIADMMGQRHVTYEEPMNTLFGGEALAGGSVLTSFTDVEGLIAAVGSVSDASGLSSGDSTLGVGGVAMFGTQGKLEYELKAGADSLANVIFEQSSAIAGVTPIEDYTVLGRDELRGFFKKLSGCSSYGRPVRIAFLGDSFIESDIMTSDLRRQLQGRFGGAGPGFVQISSQQAPFSRSVGHRWNGWRRVSAIESHGKGEEFLPSLLAYYPSENCSVEWTVSSKSMAFNRFHNVKLLYTSRSATNVVALVNGVEKLDFVLSGSSDSLQAINIEVPDSMDIRSLRLSFSNVAGLKLYGAMFDEPSGVTIDNFSLRGNSGLVISKISPRLSRQLQEIYPTDLIVMSYGLNVVSSNNTNYKQYIEQMRARIGHLRAAMPGVPILMLSVSDRSSRTSTGGFGPMRGVVALEQAQRELAKSTAVAFWSTYHAMRLLGGMETFVKNGWAAKDYTHIGSAGGRRVASALFDALMAQKHVYDKKTAPLSMSVASL